MLLHAILPSDFLLCMVDAPRDDWKGIGLGSHPC